MRSINKIVHITDQHIRNYHRHFEYDSVFSRMFEYIKTIVDEKTLIFLGGDIAHSKNEISPELVSMISKFLKNCIEITHTIIIPGNHDCNLNNEDRLDVLTPIIESINSDRLHYWKESGVYELGGISFSHYSIFGSQKDWVPAKKIKTDYKIALHHGIVTGALSEMDFQVSSNALKTTAFDGFDIVLLGDVHKKQTLQTYKDGKIKLPAIAYIGSTIQQNFGEEIDHGIGIWDLETRTWEFKEIENDFSFVTINVKNDEVLNPPTKFTKNIKLRILYDNCTIKFLDSLIKVYKKKSTLIDVIKTDVGKYDRTSTSSNLKQSMVRNVDYQNTLIRNFLKENGNISEEDFDFIFTYNKNINTQLSSEKVFFRNIVWKPLSFSFSNLFCFGENNYINFSSLSGMYGLFAKNASGKTSVMDVLLFILFDKTTRTFKASHILNNRKTSFETKFEFELNSEKYIIERNGVKDKHGNVKVQVLFYKVDENGEFINLSGIDRYDTNSIIRDYIGTYEDFLLTTMSSQNDQQNLIVKKQRERKELLYRFLDVQIFSDLYTICKNDLREKQTIVKELEKLNLDERVDEYQDKMLDITLNLEKLEKEQNDLQETIKSNLLETQVLSSKLIPLAEKINIKDVEENLDKDVKLLTDLMEHVKTVKLSLTDIDSEITNVENKILPKYDVHAITQASEQLSISEKNLVKLENKKNIIKLNIAECESKKSQLSEYKYNPDCSFCIENTFVKSAMKAISELNNFINEMEEIDIEISFLTAEISEKNGLKKLYDEYVERKKNLDALKLKAEFLHKDLETSLYKGKTYQNKIKEHHEKIQRYHVNENIILENLKLETEILNLNQKNSKFEKSLSEINKEIADLTSKKSILEFQIKEALLNLNNIFKLKNEMRNFEYYLSAMSKDGISYEILKDALPVIENEVNDILMQIVDFKIKFDTGDDTEINANIVYDNSKSWAIEMTSGMERFILSMVLRVGLLNVTALPSANFLIIDEGFGVLDGDNLNNLYLLFDYLKTKFEFVICVSHIDVMKDMVEKTIQIQKHDNLSLIQV